MRIDTSLSIHQKALLKELGPAYRRRLFDLEQVIYRDLGTYDFKFPAGTAKRNPSPSTFGSRNGRRLLNATCVCPTTMR